MSDYFKRCQYNDVIIDGSLCVRIEGKCVFTGKSYSVTILKVDFISLLNGGDINKVLYHLNRADREFLISGISPEGWKTMNSEDNSEEKKNGKLVYVTNSNLKRTLFKLDKTDVDVEGEIYKSKISFLNKLEKKSLLIYKHFFEFPQDFFENYYKAIVSSDSKKFVFEEGKPAFHSTLECERIKSDFSNYEIPENLKKTDRSIEYRDWFLANMRLVEGHRPELDDLFKQKHFQKWNCYPIRVEYDNSGAIIYDNLSLNEIEQLIDNLLDAARAFINQSERNKNILHAFAHISYSYKNIDNLDTSKINYDKETIKNVLMEFELTYKKPLFSHLREYYRIKFNPDLLFEESILTGLGFTNCKTCCK